MTARPLRARRRMPRAAAWIVATIVCGGAAAQSTDTPAELVGFQAGKVLLAPSLTVGYSYDTNVLQQPEGAIPPPEPDEVLTVQPALQLTVPFSNSSFRFGDTLTYVDYNQTPQTQGKTSNDVAADLMLNFGSLDRLELGAHNIAGVAETLAFDPGGEIGFQGNRYTLHTESIALSRLLSDVKGYRISLTRNALRFDPTIQFSFYNYRGFDGEGAIFQPLSSNTRLAFGYVGSRYDHFASQNPSVLLRTESGDTVFGEIEGQFGPRQPFSLRLGWERLGFGGPQAASGGDFKGFTGEGKLSFIVGGGTNMTYVLQRQPYRSYEQSNSYYIFNLIGLGVERIFPHGSSVGGGFNFSVNGYKQPTTYVIPEPITIYRQDRRIQFEAHANIALAKQVVFRVLLARNRRYSNAPGADYNNTVVFGGFVFGWI
jgi:hypothetical protein